MNIFKTRLFGLALTGLILAGCSQTGTYETADLMNEQAEAGKAGFKMTPFGINGNENAYMVDQYFTYSSETNTICYDEEGEFIVSFYAQNPLIECGNFHIQYKLVDAVDWINLDESIPNDGVVSASLTGLPIGEYTFRAQWQRTGSNASCSNTFQNIQWQVATDNLIVEECAECDPASFTYETEDNQNIVFTYNHGEEVDNLTLAFTFPQVQNSELDGSGNYVAPDGKIYSVNNATNQTVFTWTGDVSCKASEAETFEFSFVADCSAPPANDGKANIWTDATVTAINGVALVDNSETLDINEGPYSLKGNLANIVFEGCPKN